MNHDSVTAIMKTASENNFSHAIISYIPQIIENDEDGDDLKFHIFHVAMFDNPPTFIDIVELFRIIVEKGTPEEIIASLYIRCDTIETMYNLLTSDLVADTTKATKIVVLDGNTYDVKKEDDLDWIHGIAGNA